MAHRYGLPIVVEVGPDGAPTSLTWRHVTYPVEEILSTWHLRDRWWVSLRAYAFGHEAKPPTDRLYFRLRLPEHQIFDVYHDRAVDTWVLDFIHD